MTTTMPDFTFGLDLMNQWTDWLRGHSDDDLPAPAINPMTASKWTWRLHGVLAELPRK